jgi:hypothetical protein
VEAVNQQPTEPENNQELDLGKFLFQLGQLIGMIETLKKEREELKELIYEYEQVIDKQERQIDYWKSIA